MDPIVSWQRRMVPFMVAAIVTTAIFFAIVTVVQYQRLESWLLRPEAAAPAIEWTRPGLEPATFEQQLDLATRRASYELERELVGRRYEQASLTFAARLWTRFMGFVTGMILAFVGAAFVVGKMREDMSEISAGAQGASLSLRSASPGILMCGMGTILMSIALFVQATADTRDAAIYFGRTSGQQVIPTEATSPAGPEGDYAPMAEGRQPAPKENSP